MRISISDGPSHLKSPHHHRANLVAIIGARRPGAEGLIFT